MSGSRLNIRKVAFICCVVLVLWLLVSVVEYPKPVMPVKKSLIDFEERLNNLENVLTEQLKESQDLLKKVKQELNSPKNIEKESDESLNENMKPLQDAHLQPVLPVLVISCDRVTVSRCLDNLIKYRPNKETFPIIVSQDCGHNHTYNVIKSYTDKDPTVTVVRQPDLSEIQLTKPKIKFQGYYKIARHYKFALNYVLTKLGYKVVIIVEDDLDISPDFFEYFLGTYPLLLKDPSLWCISAWNDNGKRELTEQSRPDLLHRTDFFPGLGWLLTSEMWLKLEPNWPQAFFDDWLRDPKNTGGRACIRPEISRTYSFGKVGVSKGLFFDNHLRHIQLNADFVEFTKLDLSYLLKENYDTELLNTVSQLPVVTASEVVSRHTPSEDSRVKVYYSDAKSYRAAAKKLGLMDDFRSGIPRTAYRGIVTCYTHDTRVYLTPNYEWKQYDPNWG